MLSGRRAIDKNRPQGEHNLVEWAKPYLTNKRRIFRVLDTRLQGQYSLNRVQKVANLALQCLAVEPKFRPSMDEVVTELEQFQEPGDMPKSVQKEHHVKVQSHSNGKPTTFPKPSASPLRTSTSKFCLEQAKLANRKGHEAMREETVKQSMEKKESTCKTERDKRNGVVNQG
ncbi:hypothetical protein SCA6_001496 [Theobroma cacao]